MSELVEGDRRSNHIENFANYVRGIYLNLSRLENKIKKISEILMWKLDGYQLASGRPSREGIRGRHQDVPSDVTRISQDRESKTAPSLHFRAHHRGA